VLGDVGDEIIAAKHLKITPDFFRRDFSPRLMARYLKHQIQRLVITDKYKYLIWTDCSLKFLNLEFITYEVRKLKQRKPRDRVMMVPHPERKTVYEVYKYVTEEIKSGNKYLRNRYENEKMEEQIEFFQRQKLVHPRKFLSRPLLSAYTSTFRSLR